MKRSSRYLPIVLCLLLASSCSTTGEQLFGKSKHDKIDPDAGLSRTDYTNMFDPDYMAKTGSGANYNPSEPPIPDISEILATPEPPKLAETKLVSVAVTEDVPLKDVLIEVARLADVDIEVDSSITGGISFRAKDRPFNEVIERIADLANLRYSTTDGVLRIERDTPYIQIYSLDLLNIERSSQGNIATNTTAGAGGGGGGGAFGGGANVTSGSSSTITAKTDSDFWKQFEASLQQILAYEESSRISGASVNSQTSQVASQPAPAPAAAPDKKAGGGGKAGGKAVAGGGKAGGGGAGGGAGGKAARPAVVEAKAEPAKAPASAPGKSFYVLNRQASTLTVSATAKQHAILRRFIDKIETNASAQVLIEAKIVEVSLSDAYQSGINWSLLNKNFGITTVANTAPANAADFTTFTLNSKSVGGSRLDLTSAIKLAEQFGTTRTLSSPRLHATNNQQAVLTFAQNLVFFELKFDITDAVITNGNTIQPAKTKVTSTIHTIPIGILLSLQPSINTEKNEITLSVRPTLSRVVSFTEDPSVPITLASAGITNINVKSEIPVVEVREMDSILKVKSGQVMVIGGLMESQVNNNDAGLPGASSVPYFGNLFKTVDKSNTSKELVIFIRATIVGTNGSATAPDKNFYNKFVKDPDPLFTRAPKDSTEDIEAQPTPEKPTVKTTVAPAWAPHALPTGNDATGGVSGIELPPPPTTAPADATTPGLDIPPPSPPAATPKPAAGSSDDFPPAVPEIPPLEPLVHQ